MEIKKGIGVSPGVVISTAVVLDAEDLVVPKRQVDPTRSPQEIGRICAVPSPRPSSNSRLRDEVDRQARQGDRRDLRFPPRLAARQDRSSNKSTKEITRPQRHRGVRRQRRDAALREHVRGDAGSVHLRARQRHPRHRKRLLRESDRPEARRPGAPQAATSSSSPTICCPARPRPSIAVHVKGFATDVGGRTSHTAIVARAMGIPAVVGLGNITAK